MNVFAIFGFVCVMSLGCLAPNPRSRDVVNREHCYAQEKIFHRQTNKCYRLLTKGPCPRGHWFILELPNGSMSDHQIRIEGKCAKEKCKDGEYYWTETKSCVKPQDKAKLCANEENEEIRYNVFGEGECSCKREPPSARLYNNKDNPCYALYTQGPCPPGEVIGFQNSTSEDATCVADPCYYVAIRRKRSGLLHPDAVLAPWRNNTCYELGTEGPCPKGMTFKVHSKYLVVSCVSLTSAIFDLPQECFGDERGRCQTEIVTKERISQVHSVWKRPLCVTLSNAIFTGNSQNCVMDLNETCQPRVVKKVTGNRYLRELTGILERSRRKRSNR